MIALAPQKKRIAIVGGGISGLTAAKRFADAGYEVDIYDASDRLLGGKIQSGRLGNDTINLGAEFIDTEQKEMIQLCRELGVPLTEARDQKVCHYQMTDGKMITEEEMLKKLSPIAAAIQHDKMEVAENINSERAKHIDSLSARDYFKELVNAIPDERPWYKRWFFRRSPAVSNDTIETVAHVYGSEGGRDPEHISALHMLNEFSPNLNPETGSLLGSDCGYRVEGGTERIIEKLKEHLESKGAHFHMGAKATGIYKKDGKFDIDFENGQKGSQYDQVVMALPSYALADIEGLEDLGMSNDNIKTLKRGQYTEMAKIFARIKPEVAAKLQDDCLFSSDSFQGWRSHPDIVTFMVGGETINRHKGKKLVKEVLDKYAQAHGMTADEMFDVDEIAMVGPDKDKPCYRSSAQGEMRAFANMKSDFDALAQNGVGIVGTYIPHPATEGLSVGFMNNGVASVEEVYRTMAAAHIAREQALGVTSQVDLRAPEGEMALPMGHDHGWSRA